MDIKKLISGVGWVCYLLAILLCKAAPFKWARIFFAGFVFSECTVAYFAHRDVYGTKWMFCVTAMLMGSSLLCLIPMPPELYNAMSGVAFFFLVLSALSGLYMAYTARGRQQ